MRSIEADEPMPIPFVANQVSTFLIRIASYFALLCLLWRRYAEMPPEQDGLPTMLFWLIGDVCIMAIAYGVGSVVAWSLDRLARTVEVLARPPRAVDARSRLQRAMDSVRAAGPLALSDIGRSQWRLPDDVRPSVREIESMVRETIAIPELDALGDDAYVLRATVDRYLPEALARYYVATEFAPAPAAEAELREQVVLLRDSVARIAAETRSSGVAFTGFLRERLRVTAHCSRPNADVVDSDSARAYEARDVAF